MRRVPQTVAALVFGLAILAVPKSAFAQSVWGWLDVYPNPYNANDTIEIDANGSWDSETYEYPCTAIEFGYGCDAEEVGPSVFSSDGFYDWGSDWATAAGGYWRSELRTRSSETC